MLAVKVMSSDSWMTSLFTNQAGDDQNYEFTNDAGDDQNNDGMSGASLL